MIDLFGTIIRGAANNPPPAPYPVQTAPVYPDSDIMSVQSALREAGYYNGPIDGAMSRRCRAAIRAYQRDYDSQSNGSHRSPYCARWIVMQQHGRLPTEAFKDLGG